MPRTIAGGVLKHLGLFGPETFSTNSLVPTANTPQALQRLSTDFRDSGVVEDPDVWSRYGGVMRTPQNLEEMYRLWEEMAGWDLLAAALKEFVEETTATDSNSPGMLWYECNDHGFEDELNDFLADIDTEDRLPSQVWHVAAYGNHFEKLDYSPGEGVVGMSFVHPFDIRRFWLAKNRACIGYRWRGHEPNKDDLYVGIDNRSPVDRATISDGKNIEALWYPWDVIHFRRMFRNRSSEHGEPIFDEACGVYKKLRIAIDQMVVHRAQIQPDRYSINIDVQDQPPTEQMRTVQRWKQQLRTKISFGESAAGPGSFSAPGDFKAFYNPLALDTILWVARPKGYQHSIDKLQGTTQIPDVFDIELLTDLFYSILGMPKSWFGSSKDGTPPPSGKALLAQDIRFLRKVKSIRRPIINSYTWLAYFHAALKGKQISELDIKTKMPDIGSLEDQMKVELLERQANVLQMLGDVMTVYQLPKEAWIEIVFKKYMHLPDEVVNVFMTALPGDIRPQEGKLRPPPSTGKLLKEIEAKLGPATREANMMKQLVYGDRSALISEQRTMRKYKSCEKLISDRGLKGLQSGDVIVSSNSESYEVRTGTGASPTPVGKPKKTPVQPINEGKSGDGESGWSRYYRQSGMKL